MSEVMGIKSGKYRLEWCCRKSGFSYVHLDDNLSTNLQLYLMTGLVLLSGPVPKSFSKKSHTTINSHSMAVERDFRSWRV